MRSAIALDETAHLTVPNQKQGLHNECYESTKHLHAYSVIRVRAPLHCTAGGTSRRLGYRRT